MYADTYEELTRNIHSFVDIIMLLSFSYQQISSYMLVHSQECTYLRGFQVLLYLYVRDILHIFF